MDSSSTQVSNLNDPIIAQQAKNLTKAIFQHESGMNFNAVGDAGTSHGAGQWQAGTWKAQAQDILGDPNAPMTPTNQSVVAQGTIRKLIAQGKNAAQIAAIWNSGSDVGWENKVGVATINGQKVPYNVPAYVKSVTDLYQQNKNGGLSDTSGLATSATPAQVTPSQPSVGGFLGNVVKSGANFLGNIGEAILHPIQTVENIGGAAVGGLQELGGQSNENTAKFDGLVNYFKQRYGGVDNLLHTAYTDPIGLAGDVSAVLGVGGGLAGAAGKAGDLTEAGRAATVADIARTKGIDFVAGENGVRSTAGINNPVTAAGRAASDVLGTASRLTNPLTPVIAGVGSVLGRGAGLGEILGSRFTGLARTSLRDIYENPTDYTPEQIANVTRTTVARDVESALQDRITALEDTGSHYKPLTNGEPAINVQHNFLEDQFRKVAGLDVKDGRLVANSKSAVRDPAEISRLQAKFNLYKPAFQDGKISSEEFLNLRRDLDKVAYNEQGIKSSDLADVTAKIRNNLNTAYRNQIPNLKETDSLWSSQYKELKDLRKGFIDRDGNLTQSAIAKIANAGNKDIELARLEKIMPGITRRLQVLKVIEDIQKVQKSSGGFTAKLAEGGVAVSGLATGNMHLVAGAFATAIIASPGVAIPLIKALGGNKALISSIVAHLSKYAVYGAVARSSQSSQGSPEQPDSTQQGGSDPQTEIPSSPDTTETPAMTDPQPANDVSSLPSAALAAQ